MLFCTTDPQTSAIPTVSKTADAAKDACPLLSSKSPNLKEQIQNKKTSNCIETVALSLNPVFFSQIESISSI